VGEGGHEFVDHPTSDRLGKELVDPAGVVLLLG
jgi:hypothetical protein